MKDVEEFRDDVEDENWYNPDSPQEQVLRELARKREKRKKIRRMFGLRETVPMWLDGEHCWIVNKLHYLNEKLKKDPAILITIAILLLSFLYFRLTK